MSQRRKVWTRTTWRGAGLVELFDLLLDLVAKFEGVGDFVEWFGGAAGADDDDGSVAEQAAEGGFTDFNAFDFGEEHFDCFAADEAGFDYDAAVGDSHFGGVSADHAH